MEFPDQFVHVVGRIRVRKRDGQWRVERCEFKFPESEIPYWRLYAVRDKWEQAWIFAGWLSGKRDA